MNSRSPLVVEVTRGPLIESIHEVICVIANKNRTVIDSLGNLDYLISPRSSIKLLQAMPLLESGAFDTFQLSEKHLVLACASHKAQKFHLEALSEWLRIIQNTDSVLRCGPASNFLSPLSNNCSGKHLGMVTTSMQMKIDPSHYDQYQHPYQDYLRTYLTELSGINFANAPYGIDGCCIPTYGMSIQKLAIGMAFFVSDGESESRKTNRLRILNAIRKYPEYLSGQNDFVHRVIEVSGGRAIIKSGAEGAYVGIMPQLGLVFALKVMDGNSRAAEVAALSLFQEYGALSSGEVEKLKEFAEPSVLNSRNEKVGVIRVKPMSK